MKSWIRVVLFAWLAAVAVFVILPVIGAGDSFRLYYSNVVQTLTAAVAALLCFGTVDVFPKESPLRHSWTFIGLGVMAWALGSAIFAGYPLLHGGSETPYPYFSDAGFLLTSPLIAFGLYKFRKEAGLQTSFVGIAMAAVLLLVGGYWGYLANGEDLRTGDALTKAAALGYILFDPILLAMTALIVTSFRGGALGRAWLYVLAGVLVYVIGNQVYAYLVGLEVYRTGSLWDLAWIVGFGLIGCGAMATRNLLR